MAAARLDDEQRRAAVTDVGGMPEWVEGPDGWEVPLTTVNTLRGVQRTRAWCNPDVLRVRVDLRIRPEA